MPEDMNSFCQELKEYIDSHVEPERVTKFFFDRYYEECLAYANNEAADYENAWWFAFKYASAVNDEALLAELKY